MEAKRMSDRYGELMTQILLEIREIREEIRHDRTNAARQKRYRDSQKHRGNRARNVTRVTRKPKEDQAERPRDPIWDAVADLFFPGGVEGPSRTRVGKIVRDLKALGATPELIRERRGHLDRAWRGEVPVTPEALVKHWATPEAINGLAKRNGRGAVTTSTAERVFQRMLTEHQAGTPRGTDAERFAREKLTDAQRKDPAIASLIARLHEPAGGRREAS